MLDVEVRPHRPYVLANTEMQKLFVLLGLQPKVEGDTASPVSIALVVDTSGSMREPLRSGGVKIDEAIEAAKKLVDHPGLTAEDQLSLVQFDDDASTIIDLGSVQDKEAMHSEIDKLKNYDGGTKMGLGMQTAIEQLKKAPNNTVKKMFVLTDGETHDEDVCRQFTPEIRESKVLVVPIGVGDEYNEKLLNYVADSTRSEYEDLADMSAFESKLDQHLQSAKSEAITNTRAVVSPSKDVYMNSLWRAYPVITDISIEHTPYELGNLTSKDRTDYILELTLPSRPEAKLRVAQIEFMYDVPLASLEDESLAVDVMTEFTSQEQHTQTFDSEIQNYLMQKNVRGGIEEATELAKAGKVEDATQKLEEITQQGHMNPETTKAAEKAKEEIKTRGGLTDRTLKEVTHAGTRTQRAGEEHAISDEEIRKQSGA